jgi:hypothetical protein
MVDAIQDGKVMIIRFDLLVGPREKIATFDDEATFALQAGGGGAAIASVRRCVVRATHRSAFRSPSIDL